MKMSPLLRGLSTSCRREAALRYARMRYDDPEGDTGRQNVNNM